MTATDHWQTVYRTRPADQVGWYEADPVVSRRLVDAAITRGARSVIDVGGGASGLVDHLVEQDLERVAVLDVAAEGIAIARARLGDRAGRVEWIEADITTVEDVGVFDAWHDRAVFHFLITEPDRAAYVRLASHTVRPGGDLILATFALDGPERCSGLPVQRHDASTLAESFGPAFLLHETLAHVHVTPGGTQQRFQYSVLRRSASGAP